MALELLPADGEAVHRPGKHTFRLWTLGEALTHEVRQYCHGDRAWTDWQPCTAEQAARYEMDDSCKVRPRVCPRPAPHKRPPRTA